jgi:hypothetical protein
MAGAEGEHRCTHDTDRHGEHGSQDPGDDVLRPSVVLGDGSLLRCPRGPYCFRWSRKPSSTLWRYDDPAGLELRADDRKPEHLDLTRQRILSTDTRWTLDLHNPYTWL